jgi:CelD/BcsL family acetyltransferase involved in cellulose biosynthesis
MAIEVTSLDIGRSASALRTAAVVDLAELVRLVPDWRALLEVSAGATAFASPAFVLTWYRHFERPGGVHVVTVWRGDQLVGLAPFARTRLGGRHGYQLLVTAGTEHGDYGEPLLGPDPVPVADAIAEHLAGLVVEERAVVNVRRLVEGGAMLPALQRRGEVALEPMGQLARAAVVDFDRLDDPAGYLDRLARRHGIPRRMRRLNERYPVRYLPDDPAPDAALDAMADMLRRRWGPEAGPRLFASPRRAAFTRAVLRALADDGHGRISTLAVEDRPAAVSTVLGVGDRLISDCAAFDVDLAPFGLGQAELYAVLRHAADRGAREVDLRAGDFPYKRKWANAERRARSLVVVRPGRRGDRALTARRAAMTLRARRLRLLERHPLRLV